MPTRLNLNYYRELTQKHVEDPSVQAATPILLSVIGRLPDITVRPIGSEDAKVLEGALDRLGEQRPPVEA